MNLVQLPIIAGAGIFILLGGAHGVLTLRDLSKPRSFTPTDAGLRTAMQQSAIALHPTINLWRAWLGFNLTHSLGLLTFGSAFLYVGLNHAFLFSQSWRLQAISIAVSAVYLVISLNFFFKKPVIGVSLATACFALATALSHA